MKQQSKAMRQQSNISHFFTHIYFSFCACQMILPLCNGRASWPGPFSPLCHEPLALSLGTNWLSLGKKGLKEGSQAPDASTAHEPSPRPQPPDSPPYKCVTQTPVEGTPASTPALGWVITRASRRGLSSGWGQNSDAQVNHSPEQNSTWSGAKGVGKTGGESRSLCLWTLAILAALYGHNKPRERMCTTRLFLSPALEAPLCPVPSWPHHRLPHWPIGAMRSDSGLLPCHTCQAGPRGCPQWTPTELSRREQGRWTALGACPPALLLLLLLLLSRFSHVRLCATP